MLELAGVTKIFNQGLHNEVAAVRDIDLSIEAGSVTVIKGASGSGKTTLLTLIGCLARPTAGRITLCGEPLSGLPEQFMSEARRKEFGFVFQRFNLIPGMSALENVLLPGFPLGTAYPTLLARARGLLEELKLEDRAHLHVEHLSGGEMQRVAIARALVNDPRLLIADEPTANLDGALAERFLEIVATIKKGGKTILITSHDQRIWQSSVIDRVVEMSDGRIVGDQKASPLT